MDPLLGKLDAFEIELNIFHIKTETLQDNLIIFVQGKFSTTLFQIFESHLDHFVNNVNPEVFLKAGKVIPTILIGGAYSDLRLQSLA